VRLNKKVPLLFGLVHIGVCVFRKSGRCNEFVFVCLINTSQAERCVPPVSFPDGKSSAGVATRLTQPADLRRVYSSVEFAHIHCPVPFSVLKSMPKFHFSPCNSTPCTHGQLLHLCETVLQNHLV
jgi:hypothetical protein